MAASMDSQHPSWLNLALDTWGGTVQDGSHGVTEQTIPSVGTIKAFDPETGVEGHFHGVADIVIVDDRTYDGAGAPLILPLGTVGERTMYDAREEKYLTVTEIDLGMLNASGAFPQNGIIYAYRTDSSPVLPNGVRLTNGAELQSSLTVVTENPLYIHGDYNVVDKKPAAVIADALNLLSNAWDDSRTSGDLPDAVDTTYNVAAIAGNVSQPALSGRYSGGFENMPRFHENWSGRTVTIRGAFVAAFDSEFARERWGKRPGGVSVYRPPNRDWHFDLDFQNVGRLPPATPNSYSFEPLLWDDGAGSRLAP